MAASAQLLQKLTARLAELQLKPGATFEEVKHRWRKLAHMVHPDKHAGSADATAEFKRIQEAYEFIAKYAQFLPLLSVSGSPGSHPPPRRPRPPRQPGSGASRGSQSTQRPQSSTGSRRPPTGSSTATNTATTPLPRVPRSVRRKVAIAFWLACAFFFALVAVGMISEIDWAGKRASTNPLPIVRPTPPNTSPKPAPPPKPPTWEPVAANGIFPAEEIGLLVGTSALAVSVAFDNVDYRQVDINVDDKYELLLTAVDGTCRKEGCPVFLLQRKHGKLRDVLPNNYGLTGLTVLNRQTNGARDIIVTDSDWTTAVRSESTPADRPCHRLVWSKRTARYVFATEDPTPDQCFQAEKTAWNIAASRRLKGGGDDNSAASRHLKDGSDDNSDSMFEVMAKQSREDLERMNEESRKSGR